MVEKIIHALDKASAAMDKAAVMMTVLAMICEVFAAVVAFWMKEYLIFVIILALAIFNGGLLIYHRKHK